MVQVAEDGECVVDQCEHCGTVAATHAVHQVGTELHLADDLVLGDRDDLDPHHAGEGGVVHVHDAVQVLYDIVVHPGSELIGVHVWE